MPAHMQSQILTAMAAALVAASTAAGSRVYVDRADELPDQGTQAPALIIQAGDEVIEAGTLHHPHLQTRILDVAVVCIATGASAAADARDLGRAVEVAVFASASASTFGGLAKATVLRGVSPALSASGGVLTAELRQLWQITYATASGTPDATA